VTATLYDRRDGALYAGLNLGHFGVKLHRSDDGGATWTELPAPAFPEGLGGDAATAPSVAQLWALAAAGPDAPGTIWAGTIPGALFRSTDRGASWQLNEPLWGQEARAQWTGGGNDQPGLHSILLDPSDSRKLVIGVSCGGVWLSADGGASWSQGGEGMIATYMPKERQLDPAVQDPHAVAHCPAAPQRLWTQHHCGVFRSDDGGRHWSQITGLPLSDFGFAVAVHPADPDTAWFVPAESDQNRVPVGGRFITACTRDGGRSFALQEAGLPAAPVYDLVYRHALDVAPDGATLAMGSTTGGLWVSDNGGGAWQLVSAHLPPIDCVRFAA
jgi:photosystem II stability/assembly factor-like uncharacterized protein